MNFLKTATLDRLFGAKRRLKLELLFTESPMFQMGIMRALETVAKDSITDGHLYRNSIDSHWLGVGCGYGIAQGWIVLLSDGIMELSMAGEVELSRRRALAMPRMPDGVVPTSYRPGLQRASDPRSRAIARGSV